MSVMYLTSVWVTPAFAGGVRSVAATAFLRPMAVRNQPANDIDQEIARTAVTRVLNLRNVLQLVDERRDNRVLVGS